MKWTVLFPLGALSLTGIAAFQPPSQSSSLPSNVLSTPILSTTPRRTSTCLFVFERMSEGSIAAVMAAQEQADKLQLPEVGTEVMMAGCLNQPETKALERTLQKYRLTWRQAQRTLAEMYATDSNSGWLSGFKARKDDDDRPFATPLKQAFNRAGRLADQMASPQIQPSHIFLALLEYQETKDGKSAAVIENDVCQAGGWAVLVKMNTFDAHQVTALDVCQTLLDNMLNSANDSNERELVTGLGPSGDTPTLAECGVDLTQQARDGLLDPVFGRDAEIRACLRTLIRRRKNNVCLTGEPGVGKTAIAEGVAQVLINEDACPARLKGHRLVSLELSTLVAGTKYRGEFEERLQAIVKEVTDPKAPPTILFIDEIHNLVGAGSAEGGMDAANMLKPALARGEMQIIGATTITEYRKYIEKDAALERRLQPVTVKEPSVPETLSILEAVQSYYERHHGVRYTPEALQAMATLSDRYVNDRFLPDKALDLMDEAGAVAHLEAIGDEVDLVVDEHIVASVISEWSGIPIGKLETSELDRLRSLEEDMTQRVKGQGRAIRGVARAIRRARSGLRDPKRPIASFLFCGPTGTGKTELCKTLAETYFGSEKEIIRIDMSEYMEKHTVSRLIGSPPGYIGYDEGGQLTEAVRRAPHSVILLDEIEKAHGDVLNILLQIMEDGVLTDGKGRTVCFKNAILVMTSNVGSRRILDIVREDANDVAALNGSSTNGITVNGNKDSSKLDIEPMTPEEILKKMQSSPKAGEMMLKASQDPELMEAMRTAMNGSPADLLQKGRDNPKIAKFLQDLWSVLEDEGVPTPPQPQSNGKSGLDAIRGSMQDTFAQWNDASKGSFAKSLVNEIQSSSGSETEDHPLYGRLVSAVKEELESAMRPELLNRIDEIVVFSPLSADDLSNIARILVEKTVERAMLEQKMELKVDDSVIERIMEEGSASADQFGARPMRRAAQRYVEDSVSDAIVQGFLKEGEAATIELGSRSGRRDTITITRVRDGKTISVKVEDADGGIGNARSREPLPTTNGSTASVSSAMA